MFKRLFWIVLVVVAAVVVLKYFFDIDAIALGKGFLSWLFDLIWGNRAGRQG